MLFLPLLPTPHPTNSLCEGEAGEYYHKVVWVFLALTVLRLLSLIWSVDTSSPFSFPNLGYQCKVC